MLSKIKKLFSRKKVFYMVSSQVVANTFLYYGFQEKIEITPMKLQKLIYFLYKSYAKKTNYPLFSEQFEAWKYGPVLPSIYYEFNSFKDKPINRFARNAQMGVSILNLKTNSILFDSWNEIWGQLKFFSGPQLSTMTHQPETAWSKAFNNKQHCLSFEDIKNEQ